MLSRTPRLWIGLLLALICAFSIIEGCAPSPALAQTTTLHGALRITNDDVSEGCAWAAPSPLISSLYVGGPKTVTGYIMLQCGPEPVSGFWISGYLEHSQTNTLNQKVWGEDWDSSKCMSYYGPPPGCWTGSGVPIYGKTWYTYEHVCPGRNLWYYRSYITVWVSFHGTTYRMPFTPYAGKAIRTAC